MALLKLMFYLTKRILILKIVGTSKNQRRDTTTPKDVIEKDRSPKLYKSSCHTGNEGGNNNYYCKATSNRIFNANL